MTRRSSSSRPGRVTVPRTTRPARVPAAPRALAAGIGGAAQRTWTPVANPGAYQTFGIRPYWRQAACAEVDCDHWREGWITAVDETSQLGRRQADYLRSGQSGRRFVEGRTEAGWTQFAFHPGQTCFAAANHRVPWERPEIYLLQAGDHRAAAGPARVYDRGDQWADDFHAHTTRIAEARSRAGTAD